MGYKKINATVYSCKYHCVFCTKYRRAVLTEDIQKRFKELAQEVADRLGFEIVEMETMPDHIPLLLDVNPHIGICRCLGILRDTLQIYYAKSFPYCGAGCQHCGQEGSL